MGFVILKLSMATVMLPAIIITALYQKKHTPEHSTEINIQLAVIAMAACVARFVVVPVSIAVLANI